MLGRRVLGWGTLPRAKDAKISAEAGTVLFHDFTICLFSFDAVSRFWDAGMRACLQFGLKRWLEFEGMGGLLSLCFRCGMGG